MPSEDQPRRGDEALESRPYLVRLSRSCSARLVVTSHVLHVLLARATLQRPSSFLMSLVIHVNSCEKGPKYTNTFLFQVSLTRVNYFS